MPTTVIRNMREPARDTDTLTHWQPVEELRR
jgi:hypothetical protein